MLFNSSNMFREWPTINDFIIIIFFLFDNISFDYLIFDMWNSLNSCSCFPFDKDQSMLRQIYVVATSKQEQASEMVLTVDRWSYCSF